jgi:hypothetical protein
MPLVDQALSTSPAAVGIELILRDGRSWRHDPSQREGRGSFYNPLDPRVQDAMIAVVRDLAQRYGHHPSFTGVQVDLAHDSFAVLPDAGWGYDPHTMAAFWKTIHPTARPPEAAQLATQLSESGSPLSEQWRAWRCAQLTAFYGRMLHELQQVRPDLQLYLSTGKLAHAPAVARACVPALPRQYAAMVPLADMGVDPRQLSAIAGLVVARPWVMDAAETLVGQGPLNEWNRDAEVDAAFAQHAGLLYERVQLVPFTPGGQATEPGMTRWLIAPADRLGIEQREALARALVNRDTSLLLMGGSQPSLGELDATRDFLKVFGQLPADLFQQPDVVAAKPVVLRTCSVDARTYLYVINTAPWRVDCRVQMQLAAGTRLIPISAKETAPHVVAGANGLTWDFSLEGYGLEAALVPDPHVAVVQVETEQSPDVEIALRSMVSEVIGRMPRLQSLEPITSLVNPGFERLAADTKELAGWEIGQAPGVQVELDSRQHYAGGSSLRMRSAGSAAWVRSDPIEPPRTGRLSLHLQLRRDPHGKAPLRLAVEGTTSDKPFYRFAEVMSLEPSSEPGGWAPIVLQVTDLPDKRLHDLRVRFDLLGAGEVWIDDVRLYELSFTPKELNELSKVVALADLQLSEGELAKCYHTLRRYWPRYLLSHVPPPPPRIASPPRTDSQATVSDDSNADGGTIPLPKLPWR